VLDIDNYCTGAQRVCF